MARFLLNAAVIPGPGTYRYESWDRESACQWFQAGAFVSAVGYEETARLIRELFQVECAVNRVMIEMAPGDEALVVRLSRRVADPGLKGAVGVRPEDVELGLLRRLE
jgi:hypothetical protein